MVKPTPVHGFDYKAVAWADLDTADANGAPLVPLAIEDDALAPVG